MKLNIFAFLALFIITAPAFAMDFVTKIVSQPLSGLRITSFIAKPYNAVTVYYKIKYKNVGKSEIVANQITFVSFDVWNSFLARSTVLSTEGLDPGDDSDSESLMNNCSASSFLTGFAYVSKIRFANGKIWEADLNIILKEIKAFQPQFDAKNFKSKDAANLQNVCG